MHIQDIASYTYQMENYEERSTINQVISLDREGNSHFPLKRYIKGF